MKSSVILLLFLTFSLCGAINLPFYAKWQSLHSTYFDTLQDGKELSWDECYRAEFGIKRVIENEFSYSLAIETEQFFDEAQLRLKSFSIGYETGFLYWEANSRKHGYGSGSGMDKYPILERGYEPYRYQPMRLNSLELSIVLLEDYVLRANVGGNAHNQASALLTLMYLPWPDSKSSFVLTEDFRTMDNHWRTPVSITALDWNQYWPAFTLNLDTALALLPKWEDTEAHHEIFALAELKYKAKDLPDPIISAMYQKQNYAPREQQQYQLRLEQQLGSLTLCPITNLHIIDDQYMWQHRLFGKYRIARCSTNHSNIGAYYDYSYFGSEKGRHTFGLALDFVFEPNF
ncbi:MAG: hypothetical protein M0Q99_06225 [Candidatus Cloacimonetes bacterium]|nr:hypothetical protein [Candidatus Cloacimonadota bacterium]